MPRAVRTRDAPAGDPRVFRALSDATRRRILQRIGAKEMRATDIARSFPQRRPTIAKHLRVLLDAGLVRVRASGRERYYSVVPGPLRDAAARVQSLDALLDRGLRRLGEQLDQDEA